MPANLIQKDVITRLAARAAGLDNREGDSRLKQIANRLLIDLMVAIDDLDISMDEFWTGVAYLTQAGKQNEFGLIVPGVVLEHFLDLRLDEAERLAGLAGATARTIEGPLYIAGAPLSKGEARLDDGTDDGEVLFMEGQVRDVLGKPIAGAVVDVWHANTMGNYSHFDPTQAAYNLRRRIETDKDGRYRFRSMRLRLSARQPDREVAAGAGPPWQPAGARALLRHRCRLPQAHDPDQYRGRQISARRFRLRHPRRTDPARRARYRRT